MTLNIAIVSQRDPISGQPMVDPIGQNSPLPMDTARIILQNLKAELPHVALVCKKWKALADDEGVRQMIRPAQAFGTQEWKKYIGVEVEIEPRLPRRSYGDLEREGGFLTFIPDIVKVTKENGVIEEVILDNLEAIGNLVKKPKTDLETGYSKYCNEIFIKETRKQEKPHWAWIQKEVIGRDKSYQQQLEMAKEENKKIPGTNISGLIDTVITVFMEYIRYGKRHFILDSDNNKFTRVRVNEQIWGRRQNVSFYRCGLFVGNWGDACHYCFGFVLARKFFGLPSNRADH